MLLRSGKAVMRKDLHLIKGEQTWRKHALQGSLSISYDLHNVDHCIQVDTDKWIHQNHLPYTCRHWDKDWVYMDHLVLTYISSLHVTFDDGIGLRIEQSVPENPDGQIHWNELPLSDWQVAPFRQGWLAQGSTPTS